MRLFERGKPEIHYIHPDDFREYIRDKLMDEREAVKKFVSNGDYLAYDFSSLTRGPQSLIREIIRQRKKNNIFLICSKPN